MDKFNYLKMSRKKRSHAFIDIKNRINRDYRSHQRLFCTHDIITGENIWLDIYFLSIKHKYFYNCTICTTLCALIDQAQELAINKAYELVPEDDIKLESVITFSKKTYPEFDGKTRFEFIRQEEQRMLKSNEYAIEPHAKLHPEYKHGIGLDVCIPGEKLSVEMINAFIMEFIDAGENPYVQTEKIHHQFDLERRVCLSNAINSQKNPFPQELKGQPISPTWLKKYGLKNC